jgi:NAD(P)-dependent dehydrogenase (short-subunit alcohol dehydrogenase family)
MTSTRDEQRKRSAVITGAGSGLGRDIALGLAAKGYRVFGTAISSDEIADLKMASSGAVNLSQCDITDEAAVNAWASEVTIQNEGRIDLLISNAGIAVGADAEEILRLVREKSDAELDAMRLHMVGLE